jgi:hypothetical protein
MDDLEQEPENSQDHNSILKPKAKRTYTEEQRKAMRERMIAVNQARIEKVRQANEAVAKAKQEELERISKVESKKSIVGSKNSKKELAKMEKAISSVKTMKGISATEPIPPEQFRLRSDDGVRERGRAPSTPQKVRKSKSKPIIILQHESSSDSSDGSDSSDDEPPVVMMKTKPKEKKQPAKPKQEPPQQTIQPKMVCRFI